MSAPILGLVERLRANADPRCHQHIRSLSQEAAERIEALERRLAEAEEVLRKAQQLIEVIEQRSACNTWWVNADDPEEAVCSVASAIDAALRQAGEGVNKP